MTNGTQIPLQMVALSGNDKRRIPRPFLKWAGGKSQLLPALVPAIARALPFGTYHEPFLGGGALFFELWRLKLLQGAANLSDANLGLIETYRSVKGDLDPLVRALKYHAAKHSYSHYYEVRGEMPRDPVGRSARFIYLNKTCYNGLYRENRRGEFNVPLGRHVNPAICDEPNLRGASKALSEASLAAQGFDGILATAQPGDVVYFDPPYHPISATASFTGYYRDSFGQADQIRLAEVVRELDRRGVKVLVSNSLSDFTLELYQGLRFEPVWASRAVNSRGDRRGRIPEMLASNF